MHSSIHSLFAFFCVLEHQVEGREAQRPPRDVEMLLRQLLRMEGADGERQKACEILRSHPAWIEWLADQIKQMRPKRSSARRVRPSKTLVDS